MRFEIIPHEGVGPILFGMTRIEVNESVEKIGGGLPVPRNKATDCFFRNCFQVSYNDTRTVEFIEVANEPELEFLFAGKDVFDVPAKELLAHIRQFDAHDPELSQEGYEYIFPSLILTLWDIDSQYDHKRGQKRPVFAAVGIGDAAYLADIRGIRGARE